MSDPTYFDDRPGKLLRFLGAKFRDGPRAWRMRWGEMSFKPGLAASLNLFDEPPHYSLHLHLGFINLFITLWPARRSPKEMMECWGFSWFTPSEIHLNWGDATKVVYLPWGWDCVRHDVLRGDGSWVPYAGAMEGGAETDKRLIQEFPYRYVLNSGEVQNRTASVCVERWEHRWRWFKWLPFPRRRSRSISVEFDGEVGERSGSWKGGCIGCGYTMEPGETARDTLYRMQRERKFR